jgi:hypothetical protein
MVVATLATAGANSGFFSLGNEAASGVTGIAGISGGGGVGGGLGSAIKGTGLIAKGLSAKVRWSYFVGQFGSKVKVYFCC